MGYSIVAAGLSAFLLSGVYCNKTYELPERQSALSAQQLYTKMESYTPVLVQKGVEVYIDDIKNNRPVFATKYEKLWIDVFQKIEEQGKIGTFDATNDYSRDLWRIFENENLINKNLSDEKVLQQLDKNIVDLFKQNRTSNGTTNHCLLCFFIKIIVVILYL